MRGYLNVATFLVVLCCLFPLFAGVAGLVFPAFGYYPALGFDTFFLSVWRELLAWPGLFQAVRLSLITGLVSTVLALVLSLAIISLLWNSRFWRWISFYIAPALALPHVAFAIGLGFLMSPSGWLVRLLVPLMGWTEPPLWLTVNDPWGLSLILMLLIKEIPFLLLMSIGIVQQLRPERQLTMARSLGYDRIQAWWKVLIPQLYRQLKLPLFAVLVYGITVVDAAMIIGPQLPAPLAVLVLRWFQNPDLAFRLLASSGAILLLLITLAGLLIWQGTEKLLSPLAHQIWLNGPQTGSSSAALAGLFNTAFTGADLHRNEHYSGTMVICRTLALSRSSAIATDGRTLDISSKSAGATTVQIFAAGIGQQRLCSHRQPGAARAAKPEGTLLANIVTLHCVIDSSDDIVCRLAAVA